MADTERLHWQAFCEILAPLGASYSWEEYEKNYIGFDDRDAIRTALDRAGVACSPEELTALLKAKAEVFPKLAAGVAPFPGAVEAVRTSAALGPVALCTGALRSDVEPLLKAFGILDLFAAIVTAEDVARSKPDPACYQMAVQRLGIPAEDCLAVEDTPYGLQAARGAGCQTLGVAQTHAREELAPHADRVIGTMLEF
ncbi:MAG: HAD family phosphatase [Verrucomicrobia bacterium]|nr:HAD family phosphatase [Verrucomicrobiota bacterium]